MMIGGWESRILLVSACYSSRDEEALLLQDKDCRETTFLDYMSPVRCMIYAVKRSTDMEVCIFVRVIREDMFLVPRCTSLVYNTYLRKWYSKFKMLPAENGMPSVWLMSEEIDIDKYI